MIHAIAKNVVHNGVKNVSTLNMNMTHTVARINYSLGVGSSMYCDATDKNKPEASGFKTKADQTLEEYVFFKVWGHKKMYENQNARYIKDITMFLWIPCFWQ